jgi:hypothetical protein
MSPSIPAVPKPLCHWSSAGKTASCCSAALDSIYALIKTEPPSGRASAAIPRVYSGCSDRMSLGQLKRPGEAKSPSNHIV